jgi:O-antigen ligase
MEHLTLDGRFAWLRRIGWILLLAGGAAVLGWSIARENWLLLLAVAGVPLLAIWPVPLAFGAYAFLVPFDVVGVVGKGGAALTFLAGVLAGGVLLVTGYLRHRLERPSVAALWWFLFVVWGALTCLWAIDQDVAISLLPTTFGMLFLYLVASSVRLTREEFSWIVLATILGGCAAAAYSSSQYYAGVVYHGRVLAGRSSLILGENETDPNMFAASLFLPLSLAVGRFLDSRGWQRTLYLAMGGLITLGVVLTMSRGALIGLAVMILIYVLRLGLDRRVIVPVSMALVAVMALHNSLLGRLEDAQATGGAGRLYIWEVGFASLKHYGLFGAGLRNFSLAYTEYMGEGSRVYSYNGAGAHNIYLEVAVELGLVGLGLMAMAVFSTVRASRQIRVRAKPRPIVSMVAYEAATWAMLTSSFFVGMLWRKAFWLVWIMCALVTRLAKDESVEAVTDSPKAVRETHPSTLAWNR